MKTTFKRGFWSGFLSLLLIFSLILPSFADNRVQNPIILYTDTLVAGASYTQKGTDTSIKFTGTGSARTLTLLPVATGATKGQIITIIAPSDANTYNLTIAGAGSENINKSTGAGNTMTVTRPYGVVELKNNGVAWDVLHDGSGANSVVGSNNTFTGTNTFSGVNSFTGSSNSFTNKINISSAQITTPILTTPVGTVTIAEYGDGKEFTDILTLTNFIVGAEAGAAASLGVGNIVAAFPASPDAHIETAYYVSLSLKCAGTAVAMDTGLGSVIASGAVSVLDGTATFEDRLTGVAITTSSTGGTAVASLATATAGALTGIALNAAGSIKNVFLNAAGVMNANNTGNLTATGTVVIKWSKLN